MILQTLNTLSVFSDSLVNIPYVDGKDLVSGRCLQQKIHNVHLPTCWILSLLFDCDCSSCHL